VAVAAPPPEVELDDGVIEEARRRQRRRRFAIGGLLAGLIIAGLALLLTLGGGGDATRLQAAPPLRPATGALTPQPGQFLYIASTSRRSETLYQHPTCTILTIRHGQLWVGADGAGLLRTARGPATFISRADRAACLAHHLPRFWLGAHLARLWFAPNCLGFLGPAFNWHRFSSNPRTLLRELPEVIGPGAPAIAANRRAPEVEFSGLLLLLDSPGTPPALRAESYRAATLIRGTHVLGPVRDTHGRLGLGLTYTFHPSGTTVRRVTLIFDRRTAELLSQRISGSGGWLLFQPLIVGRGPGSPPLPLTPACAVPNRGNSDVRPTPGGTVITGRA
jgi:hypothetical protein